MKPAVADSFTEVDLDEVGAAVPASPAPVEFASPDEISAPVEVAAPTGCAEPSEPAEPVAPAQPAASTNRPAADPLTERDQRVLAFERQWWRHAGAKEQAIRDEFGLSATRYYQLLNGLLDHPAALARDPMLVKRLRRLRATRTRGRGPAPAASTG